LIVNILVIAANETRDRQKFISLPLLQSGHHVEILKTKPFRDFIVRVVRCMVGQQPDLVIFMGSGPKEIIPAVLSELKRIPMVVRLGGDSLRDLKSVLLSAWKGGDYKQAVRFAGELAVTRVMLKRFRHAVIVNGSLKDKIRDHLRQPPRLFVVPQFVADRSPEKDYRVTYPVRILTAANFQFYEKATGVLWMMEQLDTFVRRHGIPVEFSIAGGGEHVKRVMAGASGLNTKGFDVHVMGFVGNMSEVYQQSDIFVYCSSHDATPNVILESKRFGLPLLANDCIEFRNLVRSGESGLLYRNSSEFQDMLLKVVRDEELRVKLGRGALLDQRNRFSIRAVQRSLETVLTSLLKK
jgi:glycosyltransferase involved in cell wall biosynthesis